MIFFLLISVFCVTHLCYAKKKKNLLDTKPGVDEGREKKKKNGHIVFKLIQNRE